MAKDITSTRGSWADPEYFFKRARHEKFTWKVRNRLRKGPKMWPTTAGFLLCVLFWFICMAAWNTSSNILFVTLSLLLSTLVVGAVLPWMNMKRIRWQLITEPHFREEEPTPIKIELRSDKRFIPTFSVRFKVFAYLSGTDTSVFLREKLPPKGHATLEYLFTPKRRGTEQIEITSLDTQFPFGFFKQIIYGGFDESVPVWPKRVEYSFEPASSKIHQFQGSAHKKLGGGSELVNIREYTKGDPQRLVHWKASAKQRRLIIRQMAEESEATYVLHLETDAQVWRDEEQFDNLCRLAGSLSEDLFKSKRLLGIQINAEPLITLKRIADLHHFMGRLASIEPEEQTRSAIPNTRVQVISFRPGIGKEVGIHVDGKTAGSTEL